MFIKSFFFHITSLLFPETCVVCKKEGISLCDSCLQTLPPAPFLKDLWMHSLFSYQDKNVRNIIHALKFKHTQSVVHSIAPLMYDVLEDIEGQNLYLNNEKLILLPVPRMRTHMHARGFDAVLHLSKALLKYNSGYKTDTASVARINTKAQVGLSRSERLTNMKNAFKVINSASLYHQRICIIDDVITTGSTLRELRKVCLEAGAKEVFAITITH